MPENIKPFATLIQDEPWMVLDARHNPSAGRKLTYRMEDGTMLQIDVTKVQYSNTAEVMLLLQAEVDAHYRLKG